MIRLTRRYRFCASHRLHAPGLSESENRALYGKCNHPFGHGHNYVLDVSVRGPVDPDTGLAVELEALDRLVGRNILEAIDHRNLNAEVEAFREAVPTSENLGLEIYRRLSSGWGSAFPPNRPALEKIRIAETEKNIFEISSHG
ncbi:MAG: 6-pyruvoyl tetrahydrobiopterin synthase [Acidobacteria bacterium]|nr:6-pyruvoyl tetrahydrobiopterin synthase [Acidobacteriota bacterium]